MKVLDQEVKRVLAAGDRHAVIAEFARGGVGFGVLRGGEARESPDVVVVEEEDMEAEAEAEVDADQKDEPMEEGEYVADGGMEVDETRAGVEQVPEEEERKDPRQLALEEAEAALTKTDAVMELGKFLPLHLLQGGLC